MKKQFNPFNYILKNENLSSQNVSKDLIKNKQLAQRGITLEKNNTYKMKVGTFINYALTRVSAHENAEGKWFYNYNENHYDKLTESEYKKIFFNLVEEVSVNIWNDSMERRYLKYFDNKISSFDTDGNNPGVLQFNNCILDFSNEEIIINKPSPKYFCNFRLPYDYNADAECPQFIKFLNEIFDNDNERIKLIQEIMGACLFYEKIIQNLIVFLGKGSNGKSVLSSIIKKMLGENNVSAIPLDKFSNGRFSKQNLDKKLLNISSETKSEIKYSTADLKSLTGGDSIEVEKKFKDSYTTEIYCKYILLANEMIDTNDHSEGFYRRLIIIPFNKHFYDDIPGEKHDPDKSYKDPFIESNLECELPGIFNFALEGYLRLWENDYQFSRCTACDNEKKKYIEEHDMVKNFIKECIKVTNSDDNKLISNDLYPKFTKFIKDNGFTKKYTKPEFFKDFNDMLSDEYNIKKTKGHLNYYYKGIKFI